MSEKIGIGIVTCERPFLFRKCLDSIKNDNKSYEIIIVNDGIGHTFHHTTPYELIQHQPTKQGVGKSKNDALKFLLKKGCDHIFLIEDDIFIKDSKVFEKYIEASKITGIQHFNFSQHGLMNKTFDELSTPNPRVVIDYGKIKVPLYPHCVGAFSYYSRKSLEEVGLMDERYYNACEHVDHTYEIIKAGIHPPFWYFADIENSWEYLGDEPWSVEKSTISSNPNHKKMMEDADKIFVEKHGCLPGQIKDRTEELGVILKSIKKNHGSDISNV